MNTPAVVVERSMGASGWRLAMVAFGITVVVLLACQWHAAQSLVWVWGHDGTYQYAFLIFPISAWLAFDLRDRVRTRAPAPSMWGLVLVALLVAIADLGRALAINLPQHLALVAMFPALVLACWGWRSLRVLAFPLAYLVAFAVPWGDGLVGPLQDITAHIAVGTLNLTGYNVLLNGREIMTPATVWMVADACSGVKFFLACTALGCLYAWLLYRRAWKRVVFVLASAIVPIIANGLRVYFTVVIGEHWGLEYATGTDHLIFGWQFFGTVLVLLLLVGWFFRDPVTPRERWTLDARRPARWRMLAWPAAVALLLVGVALGARPVGNAAPLSQFAAPTVAGWIGPLSAGEAWRPHFAGADGQVKATYRPVPNGFAVGLFHAVYVGAPRRGHDLVTYGNDVHDAAASHVLASSTRRVRFADDSQVSVRELRLGGELSARLVWYWYCVDGHCTASPVATKLLQAWAVLRGGSPHSSVWALSVPVSGIDVAAGRKALRAFAAQLSMDTHAAPERAPR